MRAARLVPPILAGCLVLPFVGPVTAAAGEIVIEAGALTPPVLTVESDEPVSFVNHSGRLVHVEFSGPGGEHHVFQIPGRIWATFHRPGRHPYVVHFESRPRADLKGAVDVRESPAPGPDAPACRGLTVEETCLEP